MYGDVPDPKFDKLEEGKEQKSPIKKKRTQKKSKPIHPLLWRPIQLKDELPKFIEKPDNDWTDEMLAAEMRIQVQSDSPLDKDALPRPPEAPIQFLPMLEPHQELLAVPAAEAPQADDMERAASFREDNSYRNFGEERLSASPASVSE